MRWLLMLLVVLNLLFYLYNLNQRSPLVEEEVKTARASSGADLKLLSETKSLAPRVSSNDEDAGCLFLGGFDQESMALAIEQRLLSRDIDSRVKSVDEAAGIDYWVYLPPLVSLQASLRQLRELQSRNIDSYIITVGDLSNGISLGIFSRRDSAESVVSRLQGIDYAASIRELPRTHRSYWVQVVGARQHLLGEPLLRDLMRDFPELEHQQMRCSSIANLE
ncbi:SPOR domain-containing protein [Pseudomonas stutzeri]|uniref:SPOR domain-containing protein n=1 Tax=Stutzerimonas stutzeri TaxID=316 RepID=UPI000C9D2659|nr:SPOR domain-containing protein [Stutzerimonas stutzeri]MCQ4281462.1 SPOR domain-containing protein [Stutzerimonas stutzeri]PNF71101.1 sporulation protein [Stutzerimonas stutzeri]